MPAVVRTEIPVWGAHWAWSREQGGPGLTVRRFRRTFELPSVPKEFIVHVSADSRYVLYANGQRAGRGPIKGTLQRYYFETYDLAPLLHAGCNVLAAEVRWFGTNAPRSEVHGPRPGFLVQGPEGTGVDTPGEWRVLRDAAVTPDTTPYIGNAQGFLNHWERVDARLIPRGWMEADYDEAASADAGSGPAWEGVIWTANVESERAWGGSPLPDLVPRDAPMLVERPERFARTIRDHREQPHFFGESPAGWRLGPGEAGEIVLDAGHLTTGYPELAFDGGEGREVRVVYAECLWQREERDGQVHWEKGVRDDIEHGHVHGYRDTVILPGGEFRYEPLHWRTFWFVKIVIAAGPQPVTLRDTTYRFTTHPQELRARFECSDPDTPRMFETSWRTLQLCSHETYEDCPYFEQLQYIGDTRLEALCSMALAGESDFPKRAITLFRNSVRPDGLVHARVPSTNNLIIPYFALLWVLMVEDYWDWCGPRERDFVRSNLHVVDGVVRWFRERLRPDGFTGPMPKWNMVDGCEGWHSGEPPSVVEGGSTYLTCLFVRALDAAVRLHSEAGEPADSERWRPLADRVRLAVREKAWSESEGLFLERPGRSDERPSQHAQALAILSGAATEAQTKRILKRLTSDPALHRMQLMQSFYLARSLEKAGGQGASFWGHVLEPWRGMLGQHLTTWCEYFPGRSDCHAWSSWIALDFLTTVLGIRPAKPGFEEIVIRPQTGALEFARGAMPTPAGEVRVEWRRDPATGRVSLTAETPKGVPTTVILPGSEPKRFAQGGGIRCES